MITIYCGDDYVTARAYYTKHISQLRGDDYEIFSFNEHPLQEIHNTHTYSQSLFTNKRVYVGENLLLTKQKRDEFSKLAKLVSESILLLEEKLSPSDIKKNFSHCRIEQHNVPQSVWNFLDGLLPHNRLVISLIPKIMTDDRELLLLYLMRSRIKDLYLVKTGTFIKNVAPWQMSRLKKQADKWDEIKLLRISEGLYRIEKNIKTSSDIFSVRQSLEILLSLYL